MRLGNKHRSYAPLSLTLASGEERMMEVVSNEHKYIRYRGEFRLTYNDGLLVLGVTPPAPDKARYTWYLFQKATRQTLYAGY